MALSRVRLAGLLAIALSLPASAAEYSTTNFVVSARQLDIARQVGRYAEYYRRTKAVEWLGYEISSWDRPCTIDVRITHGGAGGATSFTFDDGEILRQEMTVEGSLERILHSVLPHEVTHTIFAAKFRRPLPRWADEGGAVLSEDELERQRHHEMVNDLHYQHRLIPLQRLFVLTEYPRDVMALYAQGFSLADFLTSMSGKPKYLDFVWDGQETGWDRAVRRHYGFQSVADLESQWLTWFRSGRVRTPAVLASRTPTANPARVVRGQGPDEDWSPAPQPLGRPIANAVPLNNSAARASTSTFGTAPTSPAPYAGQADRTGSTWQPVTSPMAVVVTPLSPPVGANQSKQSAYQAPVQPKSEPAPQTQPNRPGILRRMLPFSVGRTRANDPANRSAN